MADQAEVPLSENPSETVPETEAPPAEEVHEVPPPEVTPSEAAPPEPSASAEAPPPPDAGASNAAVELKIEQGTRESFNKRPDVTALLEKLQTLSPDDAKHFFEKIEALGHEPPVDEGGNKIATYEFVEKASVAAVSGAYEQVMGTQKKEERASISPQEKTTSRKSGDSGGGSEDMNEELELTDVQKAQFFEKLTNQGYSVPRDVLGKPKFTRGFLDRLPDYLASEILDAVDANYDGSDYSSSEESEGHHRRASQRSGPRGSEFEPPVLGLRLSKGINYVTNDQGEKLTFQEISQFLRKAFSDDELRKQEEASRERDASLRALIREERRTEEKDTHFRKVESLVKMQEMTMRYIPVHNTTPLETDPIELFDKDAPKAIVATGPSTVRIAEGAAKGKPTDFVHLLVPKEYGLRQMDSFATMTSTIDRKISIATMRGSLLSTHLSDMPSTFSQALLDEPSEAILAPSEQEFDISDTSTNTFMEKWLTEYMAGYVPRNTFTIRIINMISQREVELRVLKHYTMNEVCHMYMQYEDHPEYYVWKDIFGRVLNPNKSIVENGLVGQDEILEFQGYRRLPVVLLYFRDGFESEPPLPLNPLHAFRRREPGLCRNY